MPTTVSAVPVATCDLNWTATDTASGSPVEACRTSDSGSSNMMTATRNSQIETTDRQMSGSTARAQARTAIEPWTRPAS